MSCAPASVPGASAAHWYSEHHALHTCGTSHVVPSMRRICPCIRLTHHPRPEQAAGDQTATMPAQLDHPEVPANNKWPGSTTTVLGSPSPARIDSTVQGDSCA
jgi:hypothetical protein